MSEKLDKGKINTDENILQAPLIEDKNLNSINDVIEQKEGKEQENINLHISEKNIESIKSISYVVNRKIRWIIFSIFIIINVFMNFFHGTVPAATEQLRNYLNLDDSDLGFFGSLVFIGVIFGSLVSLTIINTFNRKYILMACLILCGLTLFVFTLTTNYVLLCIDRAIIGIFQAFISIYLPLWCDQFGVEARKTIMMALIQVAPPLGVLIGYVVTALLNMYLTYLPYFGDIDENERWIYSFYLQSFSIWGLGICLIFFPDKYFNSKARRVPLDIEETLNLFEKKSSGNQKKLSFFYEGNQNLEILRENNSSPGNSEKDESDENDNKEENKEKKEQNEGKDKKELDKKNEIITNENEKEKENNPNIENNPEKSNEPQKKHNNKEKNDSEKSEDEIPFLEKLKMIFSEPLFICSILTTSILFFIVTCVQYWTSDYMKDALGIEDEAKRLYAFSIVCLTAPTSGLLVGGYIVDHLGGYSDKRSLLFSLFISCMSIIPSIPLPLVKSYILYAILLWILMFFGGGILPTILGVAIVCLPKNVQGAGNSFVIFFYNLLGYLPAPYAYGKIKDTQGSRAAQMMSSWITILAPILLGTATFIRYRRDEEYNIKMGRAKLKPTEEIIEEQNDIKKMEGSLDDSKKILIENNENVNIKENSNINENINNNKDENDKNKNSNKLNDNSKNEEKNISDENIKDKNENNQILEKNGSLEANEDKNESNKTNEDSNNNEKIENNQNEENQNDITENGHEIN